MDLYREVEALTKELVNIKSVTEAPGEEQRIAEHIYEWYRARPGMDGEICPGQPAVRLVETKGDTVKRSSVIAAVKGTKNGGSPSAVILLGHLDTVDIEDYGAAKELATDPDRLPDALKSMGVSGEVIEDIKSGRYMFGRGALDMKSGVASHMAVMKHFACHPEELCGSLIAVCECDEEGNSAGVFSCLDELARMKDALGLEYAACINSDYSTAERSDNSRYIYIGSIGKILPCFAVFGKEAHVGQVFASLDPNLITAEITRRICYGTSFCDSRLGETTLPPVSLKQADTKESYTVQTALTSFSYYNVFMYGMGAADVLKKCKKAAEEAMDAAIAQVREAHSTWQKMAGAALPPLSWRTRVLLWSEYMDELESKLGPSFREELDAFRARLAEDEPCMDLRTFSLKTAEEARRRDPDKSPMVIIFPGSTYYPRVEVSGANAKEKALIDAAKEAAEEETARAKACSAGGPDATEEGLLHPIGVKMFYPYISDSSFMYVCGEGSDAEALKAEMPAWGVRYTHPEDLISRIDAPVVNIGTFGYDGHMYTERVEKSHSFSAVPRMIMRTVRELLG
ncbi:MAG: M20/M25/M40 family metallo-hydrolase [Firmicutes bacterium]|nr:M20/M25/M40 family metallo-hydrolase [Bacillota bacterium]